MSADKEDWVSHSGSTTTGHVEDYGKVQASTSEDTWGHNTYTVAKYFLLNYRSNLLSMSASAIA